MPTKKTARKTAKTARKKKGQLQWECNNPDKPYDLTTLVDMLENTPGFASFFFPVVKAALGYDAAAIECLESYLAPFPPELTKLGIPTWGVGGKSRCTDVGLLVAVIAEKHS